MASHSGEEDWWQYILKIVAGRPRPASQDESKTAVEKQNENSEGKLQVFQNRCRELEARLSKMASERMREDNPTVEDLNDPRRPTALVSKWTSLFRCGEYWTAYEKIASEKGETAAVSILHKICLVTYETTKIYVEGLTKALVLEVITLTQPDNVPPAAAACSKRASVLSEGGNPPPVVSDGSGLTPALPGGSADGDTRMTTPDVSTLTAAPPAFSSLTSTVPDDGRLTPDPHGSAPATSKPEGSCATPTTADISRAKASAIGGLSTMENNLADFLPDENELREIISAVKSTYLPGDGRHDKRVVQLLRSKRVPDSLQQQVYGALQQTIRACMS